jgi:hypothetical protein
MKARAERHLREQEVAQAEQAREAQAALTAQSQAEQVQQARAEASQQREAIAEARRNRPALLTQYKSHAARVRFVPTILDVCLKCGSENVRTRADNMLHMLVCTECYFEWYASRCWSCTTGRLDSRDPETPLCERCNFPRCAVCGACNLQGCSTNPYHPGHRQRDEVLQAVLPPATVS